MRAHDTMTLFRPEAGAQSLELLRVQRSLSPWTAFSEHFVFCAVHRGVGRVDIGSKKAQEVSAGGVSLVAPGDVHRGQCVVAANYDVLFVPAAEVSAATEGRMGRGPLQFREAHLHAEPLFEAFGRLGDSLTRAAEPLLRQQRLSQFLGVVTSLGGGESAPRRFARDPRRVRQTREWLEDHHRESIRLEPLAALLGVTKHHLIRQFTAAVGVPPYEYVTHVRIARARQLLRDGALGHEVARQVGYYDQSQLHRHFRRLVGLTPGAYARSVRTSGGG